MGKRVLILSSSPRKNGNSDTLCSDFQKGAESAGHKVKKHFLHEKNLKFCTGCYSCSRNAGKCIHNDDMSEMLQDLVDCDVVVMASPVYFYSLSGQLKTFIDRCVARYMQITNKDFYLIATAAENEKYTCEKTIEAMRGFIDCISGGKEKGVIAAGGVWNKGDIKNTTYVEKAYNMGKSI